MPYILLFVTLLLGGFSCAPSSVETIEFPEAFSAFAFEPPQGAAEGQTPGPLGPWNGRLMLAVSNDGFTFERLNQVLTDQGDVPDVAVDNDGTIYVYYTGWTVGSQQNETAVAISQDDGITWNYYDLAFEGIEGFSDPVDPDIVLLEDGTFRLYMTTQGPGDRQAHTYRFESTDGIQFTLQGSAFSGVSDREPVLDPSTLVIGETWHLFAGGVPQTNYHAVSNDGGQTFEFVDYIGIPCDERTTCVMSNGLAFGDVYRYYAFGRTSIYSLRSEDGLTWEKEEGTRLVVDEEQGLEVFEVKDAAVAQKPDGTYLMVYKTIIPGSPTPR